MKKRKILALFTAFSLAATMFGTFPASAEDMTLTPTTTSGTLTITLKIKGTPDAPAAPTKASATKNSITLTEVGGCEYSKDGTNWQDSPAFTGLSPSTEYTFYQRVKETDDNNASEKSESAKISTLADTTYSLTITLVIETHEHDWSYTAGTGDTANVITATCGGTTGTCSVGDQTATLTLDKSSYTYGDTITPTVTLSDGWTEANGFAVIPAAADVKYIGRGTTTYASSSTAPSNVGTYTAQLTVGTATAAVDFEITAGTISASADNVEVDYDGNAHGITVNVTAPTSGTTITYGNSADGCTLTESPTITNVADSPKAVYYKVTAPNYADKTGSATIMINMASQTAPAAPTKASATTSSITLTAVEGCEYSKDGTNWQESTTFSGLSQNTSYTFYQRLKEDTNHDPSPASLAANISTSNHSHTWSYIADGATISASCSGEGTCNVTTGKTLTISASTSLTYDGTAKSATLSTGYNTTAFPGTYTIEYYNGTTKLDSAPVNAGTYTAKVTAGTGDGAATASVDFTITPKTVSSPTITLSPESFTYDGTAKQPTVTVKDGTITIPASEYNIEYSNNTNAGTATVTITDKTGGNYRVSGEKTFTIERGSQSAPVVSSTNETIDGKADGTITGVTTAMEYKSAAANAYTSVSGTTIANLPAGTYNVRYKENANYNASPAADVVINTGSKLTVQFDADGGSPAPASQQLSYSQTVTKPETDPEKTGYTFLYWSADGEAEYNFSAPLTANITLKAVYQLNTYTITFIDNGNEYESQLEYGEALAEYIPRISWTGHTFMGWSPEVPETVPAEDMTFTAQWQVNQYTMTFDDNGSHSEYVLDYGTNLTDYIPDIQWEGHTFMGWNPVVPETVPAEDMTFTAVWDTNTYTITFDSNGGSYVAPIVQDYGTKVIAPMNPMREGYAFIGWDTEIPAEMPAYDMTVKALWVEVPSIGVPRISSGTARVPSGTAQPEVTASSTDEITPRMWAVLNDDNSVTVSWEKIKNADSYILYVEKNGKAVKLTETKDREVTLSNAKNGVTYKFSLKYTRNGSTFSAPKGYKANLRVYYKPTVTATTVDGKILLKWNKVANADKYVIYRVNASGKLVKAGTTTKTAARIAAKSTDTGYVVRASVNGKMTPVTKSDIATAE